LVRHALSVLSPAADGCIARMIRKTNRARLTSDAALLLLSGIGLLVCHESSHDARAAAKGVREPRALTGPCDHIGAWGVVRVRETGDGRSKPLGAPRSYSSHDRIRVLADAEPVIASGRTEWGRVRGGRRDRVIAVPKALPDRGR
jgi:hypothetical protein